MIKEGEYNFLLKGPLNSSKIEYEVIMFHTLIQSEEPPYEYYIGLDFEHSGRFELYMRFNGTDAPIFPMVIMVYSTQTDPENSRVVGLELMSYQICSIFMTFEI